MPLFIAGLFQDRGQADRVISAMLDAGVPSSEISLVFRERAEEDVSERDGESAGAFSDLAIHSAWERLGWLGGARPAYRDRVAPDVECVLVAAGPASIAIGGAQVGAAAGGVVGAMGNFGFPLELARQWHAGVLQGRAWVMVRTGGDQAGPIRQVFEKYRPELGAESLRHW